MGLRYTITIQWNGADDAFVATVPDLLGCMAHGKTQEAAIRNIEKAIELWIAMAREFADPVPAPRGQGPTRA